MSQDLSFAFLHFIMISHISYLLPYFPICARFSYHTVDRIFTERTIGPGAELNGYEYSKAIYTNLENHNDW